MRTADLSVSVPSLGGVRGCRARFASFLLGIEVLAVIKKRAPAPTSVHPSHRLTDRPYTRPIVHLLILVIGKRSKAKQSKAGSLTTYIL